MARSLPIPYHVGSGPAKVHLVVEANWDEKRERRDRHDPRYDSRPMGRARKSSRWLGERRRGSDLRPGSLLEEARWLGELLETRLEPKRTIIYCAWDGEEQGCLAPRHGLKPTERTHAHAAIYINSDSNGRGYSAWKVRIRSPISSMAWCAKYRTPRARSRSSSATIRPKSGMPR